MITWQVLLDDDTVEQLAEASEVKKEKAAKETPKDKKGKKGAKSPESFVDKFGETDTKSYAEAVEQASKQEASKHSSKLNPLATFLGPIQEALWLSAVLPLRTATGLLSWTDPFLTTWYVIHPPPTRTLHHWHADVA